MEDIAFAQEKSNRPVAHSTRGAAQLVVTFKLNDDPTERTRRANGRVAWTLLQLKNAGASGITPFDRPAPRWSEYVRRLRHDLGVNIVTLNEKHAGSFAGHHGRYVLESPVTILEIAGDSNV